MMNLQTLEAAAPAFQAGYNDGYWGTWKGRFDPRDRDAKTQYAEGKAAGRADAAEDAKLIAKYKRIATKRELATATGGAR